MGQSLRRWRAATGHGPASLGTPGSVRRPGRVCRSQCSPETRVPAGGLTYLLGPRPPKCWVASSPALRIKKNISCPSQTGARSSWPEVPGPHLCRTMGVGRVFSGAHCRETRQGALESRPGRAKGVRVLQAQPGLGGNVAGWAASSQGLRSFQPAQTHPNPSILSPRASCSQKGWGVHPPLALGEGFDLYPPRGPSTNWWLSPPPRGGGLAGRNTSRGNEEPSPGLGQQAAGLPWLAGSVPGSLPTGHLADPSTSRAQGG